MTRIFKEKGMKALNGKWGISIGVLLVYGIASGVASQFYAIGTIFIGLPLLVGVHYYFINLLKKNTGEFDDLLEGFRDKYVENAFTLFLMNLYIVLWTLLLIIPGIVKSFSYAMVPYIMADKKFDLTYNDAITESRKMMDGRKMDLFILRLSFIGWVLLGILTLGILYFWLAPYIFAAETAFYLDIVGDQTELEKEQPIIGHNEYKQQDEEKDDEWDF
jgi:uncharacterized membrane protein